MLSNIRSRGIPIDDPIPIETIIQSQGNKAHGTFRYTMRMGFQFICAGGPFTYPIWNSNPIALPYSVMVLKKIHSMCILAQTAGGARNPISHYLFLGNGIPSDIIPTTYGAPTPTTTTDIKVAGALTPAQGLEFLFNRERPDIVEPPQYSFKGGSIAGGDFNFSVGAMTPDGNFANGDLVYYTLALEFEVLPQ